MCVWVGVYMCVCVSVWVYVCGGGWMCVCVCVSMCACVWVGRWMCVGESVSHPQKGNHTYRQPVVYISPQQQQSDASSHARTTVYVCIECENKHSNVNNRQNMLFLKSSRVLDI